MIPILIRPRGFHLDFTIAFFLILMISISNELEAQDVEKPSVTQELKALIQQTDSLLGADDELINGKIYIQENLLAEGHPYFLTSNWQKGSVTVNGKKHKGLFLKYDIYTDELILKAERKRGGASVISLNNEFVESFELENKLFVNSMNFKVKGIQTDFVELLYQGNFTFFVSFTKLYNNDYNTKTPYGSYGKTNSAYFLLQDDQLNYISSKKALYNYFEPFKKQIHKFMKMNKIKYKKATDVQLRSLMEYIDQLSSAK